jgi:hypothetical protein
MQTLTLCLLFRMQEHILNAENDLWKTRPPRQASLNADTEQRAEGEEEEEENENERKRNVQSSN